MIIVMGYITLHSSDVPGFIADMQHFAITTRVEDGCIFFSAGPEAGSTGRILVTERWRDQSALTAHLEAPATEAFIKTWASRMKGDILKFDAANERGLME
ncbi:antibiotic biosynthesis monooxygenase [bacterium]|nr:antibiotic biosynthesis monooxygenase [bacterium]